MERLPLLVEFAPRTSLHRERDRVSLPTDQIVFADDTRGFARVGFGGMEFAGLEGAHLIFVRVRDFLPTAGFPAATDDNPAHPHRADHSSGAAKRGEFSQWRGQTRTPVHAPIVDLTR